jgi:hypothetical protein
MLNAHVGAPGKGNQFGTTTTKGFLLLRAWGQGWPLGSISIGCCPFKKITKQFCTQMLMRTKKILKENIFQNFACNLQGFELDYGGFILRIIFKLLLLLLLKAY